MIDLEENSCRLYVHITDTHRCLYSLRLDLDEADYRYIKRGQVTRMCDFAVLAVTGGLAQLVAIELKSGGAYADDIVQLREGLRVLHDHFEENGLTPNPTAYFVVGRDLDKLRFALRDKLASLKPGQRASNSRYSNVVILCASVDRGGHEYLFSVGTDGS